MKQFFALLLVLTNVAAFAQSTATLSGVVTDAKTGQPLPFTNVYLNNSSRGTLTDEQGRYRLTVPSGSIEVVSSMVGHQASRQTLRIGAGESRQLNFALNPSLELSAVTVTAKRSKRWENLLDLFTKELLGKRPAARESRILNTDKLRLTGSPYAYEATAVEPLVIENGALGYRLHYDLLFFNYSTQKLRLAGTCRFENLTPKSDAELARWQKNRLREYRGSIRHLLASMVAGTSEEEGFIIYKGDIQPDPNPMRAGLGLMVSENRQRLRRESIDSLIHPNDVPFERTMLTDKALEVYYKHIHANNSPHRQGLGMHDIDLPFAYSALMFPNKVIDFTTDGWITRSYGMDVRGYLGTEGLASVLPQDWTPAQEGLGVAVELAAGKALPTDRTLDSLARPTVATPTAVTPGVFLHLDKPFYLTGDYLWLSAYVVDPTTRLPLAGTSALRVELLAPDGHVAAAQWLAVQQGRGAANLRLADTLTTGTYRLRAYTATLPANAANAEPAFERTVSVQNAVKMDISAPAAPVLASLTNATTPAQSKSYDVQFLPEGGRWLAGLPGRLGVKVLGPDGRGHVAQGVVMDDAGKEVTKFTTNALGMGRVSLTPQPGKRYVARLSFAPGLTQDRSAGAVALPAAEAEGLALTATPDSSKLAVTVRAVGQWATQPVYAVLASRGKVLYQAKWQLSKGEVRASIPLATFPAGLAALTLYDASGQPQAGRLVYIPETSSPARLSVTLGEIAYQARQIVGLGLRLRDGDGSPVAGQWSAVVQDADQVGADTLAADIRAHLLLTGELRGHVEQPNWYFNDATLYDLDDLLLTQGWRRYVAKSAADTSANSAGWTVSGRVLDAKDKPLPKANVLLSLDARNAPKEMRTVSTDAEGRFTLPGLTATDTLQVRALVLNSLGSTRILFEPNATLFVAPVLASADILPVAAGNVEKALVRQADNTAFYRDKDARQLREVTVKAKRSKFLEERPKEVQRASLHASADYTIIPDENANTFSSISEMITGRVPGFGPGGLNRNIGSSGRVFGIESSTGEGGSSQLLILDGSIVDAATMGTVLPTEVSRIEILVNAGAAGIYGVRAANGVIAVYTKKATNSSAKSTPDKSAVNATLLGYATPDAFYVPRYDTPAEQARPDRRDVLYWQPMGQSGPDGLVSGSAGAVAFPLSDTAKRLRLVVQGVTAEGQPISATWTLPVR